VIIRDATPDDAGDIAAIYAHHVLHGTASFETEPPSVDTWVTKITELGRKSWPFSVAELDGRVVGYAYVTQFRDRPAYAETCENSVYVAHDAIGNGIGTALVTTLISNAAQSGFRQMIAVIGGGESALVALHARLGFVHAGRMRSVGRKFGRLLDTVYMQRALVTKTEANST
jgi:L-amino acid N-acyltransferase YncA